MNAKLKYIQKRGWENITLIRYADFGCRFVFLTVSLLKSKAVSPLASALFKRCQLGYLASKQTSPATYGHCKAEAEQTKKPEQETRLAKLKSINIYRSDIFPRLGEKKEYGTSTLRYQRL